MNPLVDFAIIYLALTILKIWSILSVWPTFLKSISRYYRRVNLVKRPLTRAHLMMMWPSVRIHARTQRERKSTCRRHNEVIGQASAGNFRERVQMRRKIAPAIACGAYKQPHTHSSSFWVESVIIISGIAEFPSDQHQTRMRCVVAGITCVTHVCSILFGMYILHERAMRQGTLSPVVVWLSSTTSSSSMAATFVIRVCVVERRRAAWWSDVPHHRSPLCILCVHITSCITRRNDMEFAGCNAQSSS